jgi:hypothetical protein
MQYLDLEKYPSGNRDFEIIIYRDNNNDRLQLDAHEMIKGQRQKQVVNTQYVPMEGDWLLPYNEYSDFSKTMAASKQSIIIYCVAEDALGKPDTDILS